MHWIYNVQGGDCGESSSAERKVRIRKMFTKGFLYQKRQLGRRFKESQQKRFEKCLENDLEGIGMGGCNK